MRDTVAWLRHPTAFWFHPEGPLSDRTPAEWVYRIPHTPCARWRPGDEALCIGTDDGGPLREHPEWAVRVGGLYTVHQVVDGVPAYAHIPSFLTLEQDPLNRRIAWGSNLFVRLADITASEPVIEPVVDVVAIPPQREHPEWLVRLYRVVRFLIRKI